MRTENYPGIMIDKVPDCGKTCPDPGIIFDLAIMPVGAYNPWIHAHCTPEQAWGMAEQAGAEFFLPVHHQTFMLSREPYFEPIERVYGAAGKHPDRVAVSRIGQEFSAN